MSKVPKLKFTSLNQQQIQRCIQWIIEKSVDSFVTAEQGLYLCVLLGHLTATTSPPLHLLFLKSETTTRACDVLLHCLVSFKRRFSTPNVTGFLEAIAPVLVHNSSSPGWLTFAAYFYPWFGMKYVVERNIVSPKYEKDDYMRLVYLLLSHYIPHIREASPENQQYYKQFLKRIFKLAPDEGALFQLFASKTIYRFFYSWPDREKFCVDFYKDNGLTRSGESINISQKLQQLSHLPIKLRGQLSGVLYTYVWEFINSFEDPTDKDLENFVHLFLSLNLNQEQLHTIIMLISKSKVIAYQELLLTLLNDTKRFQIHWDKVSPKTKTQICFTWVKTRECANEANQINVTRAYQAAQVILSCPLIHARLSSNVLLSIREWLTENVEPGAIFHELKDIEKFSRFEVRQSCMDLVKDVLHNQLHVVNDSRLLSQFSNSR